MAKATKESAVELNVDTLAEIISKQGFVKAKEQFDSQTQALRKKMQDGDDAAIALGRLQGNLQKAIAKAARETLKLAGLSFESGSGSVGREGNKSAIVRDGILKVIVGKTTGLTGGQVRKALEEIGITDESNTTTVQLAKLTKDNKISAKGKGRGKVYFPIV